MENSPERKIYTVSQLNAAVRMLLEDTFPLVTVEGEISNFSQPSSGHIYLTLKDEFAQVRCAMFRGRNHYLKFAPKNGMQVIAQAQISLYEQRGDYQLIIQHMEEAGAGALRRKFELLKQKLETEGLFAAAHKQPIPRFPKCIGVITSPTGAAIRDIITVLKRRFPSIPIVIYPTQVQGGEAAAQIVAAINNAEAAKQCDVLIVARGGGSLEDLWPFNEEIVARAIFSCAIPIVCGVGHETDFTIADFVADVRAPTPSAAAELVSPNRDELLQTINNLETKLMRNMRSYLQQTKLILTTLQKRLQHPGKKLQNYAQQLDSLDQRLSLAINNLIKHKRAALINLSSTLETISPLATLNRGYAIVTREADDTILRSGENITKGEHIDVKLQRDTLKCAVLDIMT